MNDAIGRDGLKPGDVAVVTGAAQGLGRGIARRLAAEGARIAVWDIDEAMAAETVEMCGHAGAEARFFATDVADEDAVSRSATAVMAAWGAPYALVNNAGIHPRAAALDMPLELWNKVIGINLTGTFLCARAFGRAMADQGRGCVVNLASGRALQGAVKGAHYAASKAGIISLTKTLALEWAPSGIRVNCVIPGVSDTRQPLEDENLTPSKLKALGANIPLGRIGHADDVGGLVAFFLSPDAAYMTGQAVAINGGRLMVP
ncbi:MAG: glucose 1-dehydrogenase [Alphaproteobacteria bacterium]